MAASKLWSCNTLVLAVYCLFHVVTSQQSISDKRLCADRECKDSISIARALARYPGGNNPLFLSFDSGDTIHIKSKSAGNNPSLWGGEVNGQRGYFPKTYVKETKVLVSSPRHNVDTEGKNFFNKKEKTPPVRRRPQTTSPEQPIKKADEAKKEEKAEDEKEKREKTIIQDDPQPADELDETDLDDEELPEDEKEVYEGDEDWNEDEYNKYINSQLAAQKGSDSTQGEGELEVEGRPTSDAGAEVTNEKYSEEKGPESESVTDNGGQEQERKEDPADVADAAATQNNNDEAVHFTPEKGLDDSVKSEPEIEEPIVNDMAVDEDVVVDENKVDEKVLENDKEGKDGSDKLVGEALSAVEEAPPSPSVEEKKAAEVSEATENEDPVVFAIDDEENEDEASDSSSSKDAPVEAEALPGSSLPLEKERKENEEEKPGEEANVEDSGREEDVHIPDSVGGTVLHDEKDTADSKVETVDIDALKEGEKEDTKDNKEPHPDELVHGMEKTESGHPGDAATAADDSEKSVAGKEETQSETPAPQDEQTEEKKLDERKDEILSKEPSQSGASEESPLREDVDKEIDQKESEIKPDKEETNKPQDDAKTAEETQQNTGAAQEQEADQKVEETVDEKQEVPEETEKEDLASAGATTSTTSDIEKKDNSDTEQPLPSTDEKSENPTEPIVDDVSTGQPENSNPASDISPSEVIDVNESTQSMEAGHQPEPEMKDANPSVSVESSMQESKVEPVVSETPSLASEQTMTETFAPANEDSTVVSEETNVKSDNGFETIIEDSSTIVIDANGNLVTVVTQKEEATVGGLDVSRTPSDISPSSTLVEENSLSTATVSDGKNSSESPVANNEPKEPHPDAPRMDDVYQNIEFSSRRMLSVSKQTPSPPVSSQDVSGSVAAPEEDKVMEGSGEKKDQHHGASFLSPNGVISTSKQDEGPQEDLLAKGPQEDLLAKGPQEDLLANREEEKQSDSAESTTASPSDTTNEIPQPSTDDRPEPEGADDKTSGSYETQPVVGRMIDDGGLQEQETEEDAKEARQYYTSMFDSTIKYILMRLPPSIQTILEQEPLGLSPTMAVICGVVSFLSLLTTCAFSLLCSGGKKANLKKSLDVIHHLEEKLQLAIKEKENFEDTIEESKEEVIKMKEETAKAKRECAKTKQDLQTIKLHNDSLKEKVNELETEIDEVQQNAQSTQGEVTQSNKKTKEMNKQIKTLQEKEKKAEQEIAKLSSNLKHSEEEVTSLNSRLDGTAQHISQLETSKEQLLSEAEDWKERVGDLNERWDQREEEFKQMQESLSFKENELEVLKDCFLQLKSVENEEGEDTSKVDEKLQSMMDVSKVNAQLRAVEEDRDSLTNKLQIESEARKELEEQLEKAQERVETCMSDKMKAERQCQEAQTKLSVLSSYFKEKEMQLQRELGEQEALKKQNQTKLVSADEAAKTVQIESEALKTQMEGFKRELASSERDFRAQIAANEKKAHENWLAARAAERELKEARHEAGVLRQKLTDLERRQMMGPGGLIRPLPTRGMPPPGMLNGPPPPPGMDRASSRGSLPQMPPHPRDEDYPGSPRGGPPPMDRRGPPPPPHGMRPPHPDARSPPPRLPPHGRSPPPRMPPPGMLDNRSPPPFDRRGPLPPPHMMDRRTPPFRLPPPDMLPPHMRDGPPLPPPGRSGSMSPDSLHDPRYSDPRYGRNPLPPPDRNLRPSPRQPPSGSPRQPPPGSPRQQQSQV